MNASSFSRFSKRTVLNPQNAASCVAGMSFAPLLARLQAMRSPRKVRSFTAFKRSALLRSGFLGRNRTKTSLTNLFARFRRSNVLTEVFAMVVFKMVSLRQTLQVFDVVVSFVAVNVVNLFSWVKRFQPASGHDTVHQTPAPQRKVPHAVVSRRVRLELSENFSAARNGVKMIKESVLDSINFYAQHAVPLKVAKES